MTDPTEQIPEWAMQKARELLHEITSDRVLIDIHAPALARALMDADKARSAYGGHWPCHPKVRAPSAAKEHPMTKVEPVRPLIFGSRICPVGEMTSAALRKELKVIVRMLNKGPIGNTLYSQSRISAVLNEAAKRIPVTITPQEKENGHE